MLRRGVETAMAVNDVGQISFLHGAMQAVGRKHEHIAGEQLDFIDLHVDEEVHSERAAEDVARFGLRGFGGSERAEAHLIGGDGVVASDAARFPAAD